MKTAPVWDAGRLIGLVCTAADITERQTAQDKQRSSDERLQIALENADMALFDWHLPSGEVFFSSHWGILAGTDPEPTTTTSRRVSELVHPEDREQLRETIVQALKEGGREFHARFRVHTAKGPWRAINARGRVTRRDSLGRALQLTGTLAAD
jgi:PAS domain-containing protein